MSIENKYVLFNLGQETYAVDMGFVREIIKPLPTVKLPGASSFVKGLASIRENVVTILDLREKFNIEVIQSDEPRFIIFEYMNTVVGLWVDDVDQILEAFKVEQIPNIIHHGAVKEVINLGEKLVPILDIATLFSEEVIEWLNDVSSNQSMLLEAACSEEL